MPILVLARTAAVVPALLLVAAQAIAGDAFHEDKLHEIDVAIRDAIAEERIPGGVLLIERDGERYLRAYGNRAVVPRRERMTTDTIFDAASLTKVVATAPSIRILIERGKLSLDQPVRTLLPDFTDAAVTVRHLLTHTSGLRPGLDLRDGWQGYDEGVRRALAETPRNRPGAIFRYSDVNYILLGEIVRRISGQPLDVFARREIFEPLGMRDTRFRPAKTNRVAPTENGLRAVVHDPTARRMGGVAGHAGMFSTAEDLAKFARAAKKFGEDITPPEVAVRRACGFDLDSNYSRPRGELFPHGSFGHTGWTGGFLWIVPSSRTFYVFLSNRVHPDGKGSVVALQHRLGTLIAESLAGETFTPPKRRVGYILGGGDAMNGIDVLHASNYEALRGLRIGLITNQSGIDRHGNPTVDLLRSAPGVTLTAIFTPEHGLRGTLDDKVADEEYRGIPVYSLYGERRKPSPEQLPNLDALVFDVQDIGTRFYTYISTMGLAMEAAAEAKIRFIVLDRINPIGGDVVEGPMLEGKTNFVGWHPLPIRHGRTVGELAMQFRDERPIPVDLTVIPVRGWKREQWQDEAGLPWVNTSPNMRSLNAAALYPGIGLLERAISVGRGTDTPFEVLGAPYIDGERLAREVHVPGVQLTPVRFTPTASIHKGEECGGVRIRITDRRALRSVTLGLEIARALVRLYGDQFPVHELQPLLRAPFQ
jgi:uncharacterized protein YbbC (DUF1343 family)